jgi:tRNA nucleotidyltransferase (CCA-adding enzyme)
MLFKKSLRPSVFIVTYYLDKKNSPRYLIQKRKKHWKGWEFPKGGIEKLETKKQAVKRELKEETGLDPIKIKNHHKKGIWLYEEELKDRPGIKGQKWHLFSVEVKKEKLKIDKKEHYSEKWTTYNKAMKTLTHKNQKDCLKLVNDWLKEEKN